MASTSKSKGKKPAHKKAAAKPAHKPAAKAHAPARKAHAKPAAKPAARPTAKPGAKAAPPPAKPATKGAPPPAKPAAKATAPVKVTLKPTPAAAAPAKAGEARPAGLLLPRSARPGADGAAPRKADKPRRSTLMNRRGPNGEPFVPGDLLIPSGAQNLEEIFYYFRGCSAAERAAMETGLGELLAKRGSEGEAALRVEIERIAAVMRQRFEKGPIEQALPNRPQPPRRTFQGVAERAKGRRREIGAFLRGLDIGRTETSHMDSHGEASLQSLMEWAARLESLSESDEPQRADYGKFHRVLDQLDLTTEALIVDVEQTLRRLRDRLQAR